MLILRLLFPDGLVAINKPYGVSLQKLEEAVIGPNQSPFAVEDVLRDLAALLQVDNLEPVKFAERYTTGVTLFASRDGIKEKIKGAMMKNRSMKIPPMKYLAVTLYQPQPLSITETVGFGSFSHQDYPGKLVNHKFLQLKQLSQY